MKGLRVGWLTRMEGVGLRKELEEGGWFGGR